MNREEFGNIIGKRLSEIHLTDGEKSRLRASLMAEMAQAPRKTLSYPSKRIVSPFHFIMVHNRAILASFLALFLAGGSSISYAAENALPGDLLYPIKVEVNEPVELALATSPEAKASLSVSFADRRLEEAGKLAAAGKLSPSLEQTVNSQFKDQADQVNAHLAMLDQTDKTASAEISDRFEAVLSAHEEVLARLAAKTANGVKTNVALVAQTVHAQASKLAERNLAYAETIAVSGSGGDQIRTMAVPVAEPAMLSISKATTDAISAEEKSTTTASTTEEELAISVRLYTHASSTLSDAHSLLNNAEIGDGARTEATAELTAIDDELTNAKVAIDAGDGQTAWNLAHDAFIRAIKFGILLKAGTYDGDFSMAEDPSDLPPADGEEDSSATTTESASTTATLGTTTPEEESTTTASTSASSGTTTETIQSIKEILRSAVR
jgi:hypothetical protein